VEQALIMSAVLLVYVVSTQLGRHRAGLVRLLMPIGLVFGIGGPMLGGFDSTTPNLLTVGAGIAIGLAIGAGMLGAITVERDPDTGKAYTRAGWPYLVIWLGVLGARLIFVWAVQHVGWFGRVVGEFLRHKHIGTGARPPSSC
jgi:hypothetical protein